MYSSDSDYGDSDDEGFARRKSTSRSKTTLATPPPMVSSYETLLEFRESMSDSIILSIDFETMDDPNAGKEHYHKMSELGLAVFDPRDPKASTTKQPTSPTSSNALLGTFAKTINPQHVITNEWKHITEDTCNAPYHKLQHKFPNRAHHAQPYRCRFVGSKFMSQADTMSYLKNIIQGLSTQNLTEEEMRNTKARSIKLIVWASHCEEQVFLGGGIDLVSLCPSGLDFWDFQAWCPFKMRFPQSSQAKGETVFHSLGALGTGVPLHNGCNDAVSQLISFMRFLVMTPAEWHTWFDKSRDLTPISLDWVKPAVYTQNYAQRPIPPSKTKKSQYAHNPNKTAATTSKWNSAPKATYTAKPAPRDVKAATSNNISGQGTWSAIASNACGNDWDNNSNKVWSDNANRGWPDEIWSNDWANCSGSGWPNSPSPESNDSNDSSANISGWPPGMDGWNDSPPKSTGWPDGMINVDDVEDPSVNFSGWPAGMDDPEETTSAVASGNTKSEKDRENVALSRDRVVDNDEWFTVYHSRRGKKGPFKPNAHRR